MSIVSFSSHNRQDTSKLAHNLIALTCGDFRKLAFEPLYRACYVMACKDEQQKTLQSLLKFAIRSMLTASKHTPYETKLRISMLHDVSSFFQKNVISRKKGFLPLDKLFQNEEKLAKQRALFRIRLYTRRHFLEAYLRPGGPFERKTSSQWSHHHLKRARASLK